jgi:hypothetical protein
MAIRNCSGVIALARRAQMEQVGFAGDTANCRDLLISVNLPLAGESTQNSKPFLVQECGKTLLIDWNGKWASLRISDPDLRAAIASKLRS